MKKKLEDRLKALASVRKPIAPPSINHHDKNRNRKPKHKGVYEDG